MNRLVLLGVCLIGVVSAYPRPQAPGPLQIPGAEGYGKQDGYFQYINVPAPKTYEWGYRRGNDQHNREEYLSQKDHTFKAKLKWADAYDGHGEHYYDYNHVQKYEEPAYVEPVPSYAPAKPAYSPPSYS
ncbi:uncharacterized protein LOC111702990 [Eurytemora carolleeae]|uniref:uncharacterized protein LOC111702990 n=1 Tax=Eurytemora carolleeae TaxID=1294199 RepID=UPI000C75755D|nr:uncharacterized protein LOC111702990 [Eurytemora carolleeae]|eukprot:XP_023330592.1 uncharacterized protein LOC111702990 [Eurytemora affinis]